MDNVAIAHKDYDVRGGGEILAERLATGFDADLIVGHENATNQSDNIEVTEIGPDSKWHRLADRGGLPRAIAHWMLWRDYADAELSHYDTVITSGNEPLWWTSREDQTWVAYTHSTPRWQYDLYHKQSGWSTRMITQLKRWIYEQEVNGPDLWVANSDIVARRMQRYWNINPSNIDVVYPPIETGKLSPDLAPTGDYYLSLGRLDDTKRVSQLVTAANELNVPLKIAGTGPNEAALREQAGDTVEFLGWVEANDKRKLLSGAKAMLSACMNEDFGMAVIEALASGTPVITVAEGMPQYTVSVPERGVVYAPGELTDAIKRFESQGTTWTERKIANWADRHFSTDRFIDEMKTAVETARENTTITPQFND